MKAYTPIYSYKPVIIGINPTCMHANVPKPAKLEDVHQSALLLDGFL